jgi:hypothetical protein
MDISSIRNGAKAKERSTSVSDNPSKEILTITMGLHKEKSAYGSGSFICIFSVLLMLQLIVVPFCSARLVDRVIAYVDDYAITYSEFREKFENMRGVVPGISEEEAVNSMINTLLLLAQARKMRLEAASDDDLVKEYVDMKIKSRIFINEDRTTEYYNNHKGEFEGKEYLVVRDIIEKYLLEVETNKQLKEHLAELRGKSNIVIQLRDK